ncbi:hypothetical protein ACKI2N_001850 [Cupriavidus sp. 30B13]|uniref:hypothetical protein n=1 Tax=unclassified Cupriavidus TaxID=2640874 RepID=UPI00035F6A1C|nr:hypothetical protein [Cupriavidus sp. WS]
MTARRISRAELIEEFHRVRGSGRAEEQIEIPAIRKQLARSRRAFLKAQARRKPARPRFDPTVIDHKRRQANDLD